jgi:hypothetical protein
MMRGLAGVKIICDLSRDTRRDLLTAASAIGLRIAEPNSPLDVSTVNYSWRGPARRTNEGRAMRLLRVQFRIRSLMNYRSQLTHAMNGSETERFPKSSNRKSPGYLSQNDESPHVATRNQNELPVSPKS